MNPANEFLFFVMAVWLIFVALIGAAGWVMAAGRGAFYTLAVWTFVCLAIVLTLPGK